MRCLTLRLAVALLTFIIGITAAFLWVESRRYPEPKTISVEESKSAPPADEKKRTYEHEMQASGYSGSYRACFGALSSTDGMKFSSTNIYFGSPKRANRELQKNLKQAVEVIKREPTFDKQGGRVGEKVIATFAPYEGSSAVSAKLLWTEGADFGYIISSSLQNILEYEKDHQR